MKLFELILLQTNICMTFYFQPCHLTYPTYQTCLFSSTPPCCLPLLTTGWRCASVKDDANINDEDELKTTALRRQREVSMLLLRRHPLPRQVRRSMAPPGLVVLLQVDGRRLGVGRQTGRVGRQNKRGPRQ